MTDSRISRMPRSMREVHLNDPAVLRGCPVALEFAHRLGVTTRALVFCRVEAARRSNRMQFLEIHHDVTAWARDNGKVTEGLNEMLLYGHAIASIHIAPFARYSSAGERVELIFGHIKIAPRRSHS